MSYTSLHNHTEYSNLRLLDCINKVEDLIKRAYELGLNGVAITDHEALSAHIKALKFYKQQCKDDERWNNFKLILGNEIYLCRNGLNGESYQKGEKFPHFILLAKDAEGHKQLRELENTYTEKISELLILIQIHCEIQTDMYMKMEDAGIIKEKNKI